jgi:hypothetical protein
VLGSGSVVLGLEQDTNVDEQGTNGFESVVLGLEPDTNVDEQDTNGFESVVLGLGQDMSGFEPVVLGLEPDTNVDEQDTSGFESVVLGLEPDTSVDEEDTSGFEQDTNVSASVLFDTEQDRRGSEHVFRAFPRVLPAPAVARDGCARSRGRSAGVAPAWPSRRSGARLAARCPTSRRST